MKLIKIDELGRDFQNLVELKTYALEQTKALQAALSRIIELESQLKIVSLPVQRIERSTEERICEDQLRELKELSDHGQLEFEDVKKFDLLVKNLHAIREKTAKILSVQALPAGTSEAQLIQLAALKDE